MEGDNFVYSLTDPLKYGSRADPDIFRGRPAKERAFMAGKPRRDELEKLVEERTARFRESERKYARAAEIGRLGYWEGDFKKGTATWSRELYRIFGYAPDEVEPTYEEFLKRVHPDDREMLESSVGNGIRKGAPLDVEYRMIRPDGEERIIHSRAENLLDRDGNPSKSFGIIQDITERKQTQSHLRLLSLAVDQATEGMAIVDMEGAISFINKAFAEMHGYTVAELAGRHLSIFHTPDQMPAVEEANRQIREHGRFNGEIWHVHRDGRAFPTLMENSLVLDEAGDPVGMIATLRDITDQKAAENALQEERDFSRLLVEASPAFFVAISPEGSTIMMNRTMRAALGYEEDEVRGADYLQTFVPEEDREPLEQVFNQLAESPGPTLNENRVLTRDGRELLVEWHGRPVFSENGALQYFFGFGIDITERGRMEKEMAKVQRLEALGILAGGIAHDFNNILTAILANISMARVFGDLREDIADMLQDAENASTQARKLTQQLLTFARGGAPIKKAVSLAGLLKDTAEFAVSGSRALCVVSVTEDLWPVDADEGQISQVIQNLIINADQAMSRGGAIRVGAENVSIGPGEVPPLKGGSYVRISVLDQGTGISRKDLPHIFDPFFTTKPKGSGLGLATAFSVVGRHGGHIRVNSRAEEGTVFHVYLPASSGEVVLSPGKAPGIPVRGEGRVLVIDDEAFIRKTAGEMLRRMGFQVSTAEDHEEGIALYRTAIREELLFKVVIMDLTIPGGLGGREALERLRQIDPEARVIVSSGYSQDPVMARFRGYGFSGMVAKPYRIEDLAEAISGVLKVGPG